MRNESAAIQSTSGGLQTWMTLNGWRRQTDTSPTSVARIDRTYSTRNTIVRLIGGNAQYLSDPSAPAV